MNSFYYPPPPVQTPVKEPGAINKFVRWCGRVTLYLLFWPAGLWRSAQNRNAKRHRQVVNSVRANPTGPVVMQGYQPYPSYPPPPPPPPVSGSAF